MPAKKPRKLNLPDSVMVLNINRTKKEQIPAVKAFELFGFVFFAHPTINRPKYWTITESTSGASCGSGFTSKSGAIKSVRERIESIGQDALVQCINRAKGIK
jgi:hypothetical protein